MTDRRKSTDYETETFQDPDAPDVDVQQGRPDPIQGDASPEARARVNGSSLEGQNPGGTGGFLGISMGIFWAVAIVTIVGFGVILYFAL